MSVQLLAGEIRNRIVEVRKMRFGDVAANPRNPKYHPANQRNAIRGSVRELGFGTVPIVYVSQRLGGKVAWGDGHLRGNEFADYVGDVALTDYTDEEIDKFLLYADPIAAMAEYESQQLDSLLKSVQTGDESLMKMLAGLAEDNGLYPDKKPVADPGPQTDRATELQEKWGTAEGDIWRIGEHVVICGDCRQPDTWQRLLSAAGVDKVNGVFTSPPYAEQRKAQYGGVPTDEYVEWWEAVQANVRGSLAADGSFFVNIKEHSEAGLRSLYVFDLVCAMVRRFGWQYRDDYRWTHGGTPGDADMMHRFKNQHEPIFWFTLATGFKFRPMGVRHKSEGAVLVSPKNPGLERIQGKKGGALVGATIGKGLAFPGNVLLAGKNNNDDTEGHEAAFPVALPDFFIRAYSDPGDVWCDPFLGSGTTIVAAHQNKRRGLGIEMLPKYLGIILERLATVTNSQPVRVEA